MSFDNFNNKNKKLNLFILVLLTFIVIMVMVIMPFTGYLGWALMPIPATLLVLTGRKRDGVICAVLGTVTLLFLNYILAGVILTTILGTAFAYLKLNREGALPGRYILYIVSVFIGASVLFIGIISLVGGTNPLGNFMEDYRSYIMELERAPVIAGYGSMMGIEGQQFSHMLEQTRNMLMFMPYLLPGMWAVFMSMAGVINYALSSAIGSRYGIKLKKLPPLGEWDLPWYTVWGLIAAIAFFLVPTFTETDAMLFYVLGANLAIIFGFVYFVLGIAVIWGLFNRFRLQIIWRIIILMSLFLFFALILIVPILGLVDIWLNLRKLERA